MKLTRYFQSCLLIEEANVRILFDPSGHEAENFELFGKLDAVLYTHEHADHFDANLAKKFADAGVPIYANASTAKQMKSQPTMVEDGQGFSINGLSLKALELPHCLMTDGSAGPQNTGYLIAERIFNPGDGKALAGLSAEVLLAPITGPDISLKDAYDFAKQLGSKTVVPVHYDYIGTKPEVFKSFVDRSNAFDVVVVEHGASVDV